MSKNKFTTKKTWEIFKKTDGQCAYCGREATTVDHIIPQSDELNNDISNLVPSCKSCNSRKSTLSLENFRKRFSLYSAGFKSTHPQDFDLMIKFGANIELLKFSFEELFYEQL